MVYEDKQITVDNLMKHARQLERRILNDYKNGFCKSLTHGTFNNDSK
jgi:hypothetical protein